VLGFSILEVDPEKAGNVGTATLLVKGAAFKKGDTISLRHVDGEPLLEPVRVLVRNSGCILATFEFDGEKLGFYDVIVSRTDDSTVLVQGFELIVLAPIDGTPVPEISILMPDVVRLTPLVPMPFQVVVSNPHGQDIAALVNFSGSLGDGESGGLYSTRPITGSGRSQVSLLPSSENGMPGRLRPGETVTTTMYYHGVDRPSTGENVHQEASSVPVDDTPVQVQNKNEESVYHEEYVNKVGNTRERNHKAASEEATRLAEMGVTETDYNTLLSNIYEQVTGVGSYLIKGRVLNPDKAPFVNKEIKVVSTAAESGWSYTATTDGQGCFLLPGLPQDEYYVVAEGYGRSDETVLAYLVETSVKHDFCLTTVEEPSSRDDYSQFSDLVLLHVEGVPHLFFVRRGIVHMIRYENGAWTEPLPIAVGTSPVPMYSAALYQGSPAIAVFSLRRSRNQSDDIDIPVDLNDSEIMITLGLSDGNGGWLWHEAVPYANHDGAGVNGFDAILDGSGIPVAMWTAQDVTNANEDSELYYKSSMLAVDLLGDPIEYAPPEPPQPKLFNTYGAQSPDFHQYQLPDWDPSVTLADPLECKLWKQTFGVSMEFASSSTRNQARFLTKIFGTHSFSMSGVVEGEGNLKEAKAGGGIDASVVLFSEATDAMDALEDKKRHELTEEEKDKLPANGKGIVIGGKVRMFANWKMDRNTCHYVYDKATAELGIAVRARVPIPSWSFDAGKLGRVYVGIQIDGVLGGEFEWATESYIPSLAKVEMVTGVGGYFSGRLLDGAATFGGSLLETSKLKSIIRDSI
jgi:hypothetical protein